MTPSINHTEVLYEWPSFFRLYCMWSKFGDFHLKNGWTVIGQFVSTQWWTSLNQWTNWNILDRGHCVVCLISQFVRNLEFRGRIGLDVWTIWWKVTACYCIIIGLTMISFICRYWLFCLVQGTPYICLVPQIRNYRTCGTTW